MACKGRSFRGHLRSTRRTTWIIPPTRKTWTPSLPLGVTDPLQTKTTSQKQWMQPTSKEEDRLKTTKRASPMSWPRAKTKRTTINPWIITSLPSRLKIRSSSMRALRRGYRSSRLKIKDLSTISLDWKNNWCNRRLDWTNNWSNNRLSKTNN